MLPWLNIFGFLSSYTSDLMLKATISSSCNALASFYFQDYDDWRAYHISFCGGKGVADYLVGNDPSRYFTEKRPHEDSLKVELGWIL
ncbi:hypothetical protein AAC387_Pa06g1177 [Persea americana]